MNRFLATLCLLGGLAVSPALAQEAQGIPLEQIRPLPHVMNLEPMAGQTLLLKSVTCQAEGKPVTQGRLYLARLPGNQVRAARVEYNDQGKYVLEHATSSEKAYKYFDQYVTQQKPFTVFTMNTLIGMWKVFGLRFKLENTAYQCSLT